MLGALKSQSPESTKKQLTLTWSCWLWNLVMGLIPTTSITVGVIILGAFQVALVVKNPPANAGDTRDLGLIPESGRSPTEGNVYPLQYSCLENPMDRGVHGITVHGVTKSWTQLSTQCVYMSMSVLISRFILPSPSSPVSTNAIEASGR